MRHLFDQYSQPENRLTHALVSGLAKDQRGGGSNDKDVELSFP